MPSNRFPGTTQQRAAVFKGSAVKPRRRRAAGGFPREEEHEDKDSRVLRSGDRTRGEESKEWWGEDGEQRNKPHPWRDMAPVGTGPRMRSANKINW
ncbi:hypothetical protein NDU88_003514 [Pleurodeles waltl]|uniref:Uncharacterized protein n=1 Tax=Pleurodeles waltl TaxID=8319 RepID=A0AAV7T6D8_PLEWA|nr:hypothetical protein NDU88_003514 [Pleurodeles waltl]